MPSEELTVSVSIVEQDHPAPTDVLCVPIVNGVIFLQWKNIDHENVLRYNIYISKSENGNYKLISTTSNKMTYLKSLPTGTSLYFRVSAKYKDGHETEKTQGMLGKPKLDEHNIRITAPVGTKVLKDSIFNFIVKETGRSVQLSNIFDIEL